jgi:hypothetical protein
VFEAFTVEELRYYDYLRSGYITAPPATATSFQTNTLATGQRSTSSLGTFETRDISPWERPPDQIAEIPAQTQVTPYGALPASHIAPTGDAADDLGIANEEEGRGFPRLKSLTSTLNQPVAIGQSATPGIRHQFVARDEIHDSAPFESHQEPKSDKPLPKSDGCIVVPPTDHIVDGTENVSVVHREYGTVCFVGAFRKAWLGLAHAVDIGPRIVSIGIGREEMESMQIPDRFPVLVTLNQVWPGGVRQTDKQMLGYYEMDLREFCENHGLQFVGYQMEAGAFRFTVPRLSVFPVEPPT